MTTGRINQVLFASFVRFSRNATQRNNTLGRRIRSIGKPFRRRPDAQTDNCSTRTIDERFVDRFVLVFAFFFFRTRTDTATGNERRPASNVLLSLSLRHGTALKTEENKLRHNVDGAANGRRVSLLIALYRNQTGRSATVEPQVKPHSAPERIDSRPGVRFFAT